MSGEIDATKGGQLARDIVRKQGRFEFGKLVGRKAQWIRKGDTQHVHLPSLARLLGVRSSTLRDTLESDNWQEKLGHMMADSERAMIAARGIQQPENAPIDDVFVQTEKARFEAVRSALGITPPTISPIPNPSLPSSEDLAHIMCRMSKSERYGMSDADLRKMARAAMASIHFNYTKAKETAKDGKLYEEHFRYTLHKLPRTMHLTFDGTNWIIDIWHKEKGTHWRSDGGFKKVTPLSEFVISPQGAVQYGDRVQYVAKYKKEKLTATEMTLLGARATPHQRKDTSETTMVYSWPRYAKSFADVVSYRDAKIPPVKDAHGPRLRQLCRLMSNYGKALEALHGQGLVHRDLKPENIGMLADGNVVIADHGFTIPQRTTTAYVYLKRRKTRPFRGGM